ncbi:hypothetical protein ACL2XP_21065 [Sodalis sp. RH21]|uniref:hypothetical protein n=1 Tax=unclassified Sodalis (in: enterobacteria) TaxID=2636512 RepID=UPI0039B523EE
MDGALIFCKDAILRFRSDYDNLTAVPLLAVQACLDIDDHLFLLQYFRHHVIIEEGTTLSHIFLAIEPWAKVLGVYLDMNVVAYIDEIRKPSQAQSLFDWIGIQKVTSVHRAYLHQHIKPGENFDMYFNRERTPTRRFDIEVVCTANGYKNEDKEHYSISGDIHAIKNVPVVASDRQILVSYGYEKSNLMNDDYSGVSVKNKISYIQGEVVFLFYEVLEAIFKDGLFYSSPQAANDNLETIKEMVGLIDNDGNDKPEAPGPEYSENTQNVKKDKKTSFDITERAYDPILEHMQAEQESWQFIKSHCDSNSELPIRIGHVAEAKVPEYRFSNFIINENE